MIAFIWSWVLPLAVNVAIGYALWKRGWRRGWDDCADAMPAMLKLFADVKDPEEIKRIARERGSSALDPYRPEKK